MNNSECMQYLIKEVLPKFEDSTFEKYVREKLASDFIYNLANYIKKERENLEELKNLALSHLMSFKDASETIIDEYETNPQEEFADLEKNVKKSKEIIESF